MSCSKYCILAVGLLAIAGVADAMPGAAHDTLSRRILNVPPAQGGALGITPEKATRIGDWMDWPATQTGRFQNHIAGSPIRPSNHADLRHNPLRVARALSGDGSIDPGVANIARLHKIADVAHNKVAVDGIQLTPRRVTEARQLLDYVKENGRLPRRLPEWVDARGAPDAVVEPLVLREGAKRSLLRSSLETALRSPAAAAGVSVLILDSGLNTWQYCHGEMSHDEFKEANAESAVKSAAVATAVKVVYLLTPTPHGLVVAAVVFGTYLAVDAVIAELKAHFDTGAFQAGDLRSIISDRTIGSLTISDVAEGRRKQ